MTEQNILQLDCLTEILKPFQFCTGSSREECEIQHEMTHLLFMYFIVEGMGEVRTKKSCCSFRKGDIICVFPGKECSFSFKGQENSWYWISMEIGSSVEFNRWNHIEEGLVLLGAEITPAVAGTLQEVEQSRSTGKERPYRIMGMLYTLMDQVCKNLGSARMEKLEGKDSQSVAVAAEYIALNYYHKIDVDAVCRYVNYSRYYFSRCFKEIQGMSIMEYINKVRLDRAIYLLNHTELTVIEVAKSVGFDDPFYFSRKFKAYTGVPPSRFKHTYE